MSSNIREVKEGLILQGIDEAWRYSFDTSPIAGTASGTPTAVAWDEKDNVNVSATVLSGTCSLSSTTITTSIVQSLRLARTYKIVVTWSVGASQTRSRYFRVQGEL